MNNPRHSTRTSPRPSPRLMVGLTGLLWAFVGLAPAADFDLGLRYDRSRSGHGLEIHRAGEAYPVFFYTYRDDLSPDWFFCDTRIINGVMQGACNRFVSGPGGEPPQADSSDRAFMTLDHVAAGQASACQDGTDRSGAQQLAVFSFSTNDEHQDWCTEFLPVGTQFADPYFGGLWYGGDNGGYGCTLSHMDQALSAICYYYDGLGEPRWTIGLGTDLDLGSVSEIAIPLIHYEGFCRGCVTTDLQPLPAGTLTLMIDPERVPGDGGNLASLALEYPQRPGGEFHRDFPLFRLTDGDTRGTLSVPETAVQSAASVAAWEEDLQFFSDQLRIVHPDPFHDTTEATFEAASSSLGQRLPFLDDARISFEFAKLGALISRNGRDGHTSIITTDSALMPLQFYAFSDGMFIVDALPPFEGLVGSKVLGVADQTIDEVIRTVNLAIPRDNENSARWITPIGLLLTKLYQGSGIVEDAGRVPLNLMSTDGLLFTEDIIPITFEAYGEWKEFGKNTLPNRDILYLSNLDQEFWFTSLDEGQVLYVQYNQVVAVDSQGQSLQAFANQLNTVISQTQPSRIIIDLRHNNGGDNTTYGPLLDLLSAPAISQDGRLLAIIGRQTFSAAMNFIADLEARSDAVFVGEGSGGSPFHFGDSLQFLAPNSQLLMNISSRVHASSIAGDQRLEIPADVQVELSSQAFFSDSDPILTAALDQVPE